ncbi:MAG: tyrosine--tRNA ligase [Patescibacteria group bacterium]
MLEAHNKKLLERGVEEVIVKEHLEGVLKNGKKLRVKFGIDPTAPDLHLGHTVPLRKLRQFQDAGHTAILIIGDFTAMIGDPSGRSDVRKPLTIKEVKQNMKKYLKQAGRVINLRKAEIHYNSKWYAQNPNLILELEGKESIQRLLERDDFQKRLKAQKEISLLETVYPLLQGYDSVMVKADVEIGGTDQKFNLLMGRRLQRAYGLPEQDILTTSLLEGTDGVKKMSKSVGNYIGLDAEPADMFGKIMSVPDNLIDKYYTLLTDEDRKINDPKEAKLKLARIIVSQYHGEKAGNEAQENFINVFSKHGAPSEMPRHKLRANSYKLIDLLLEVDAAPSRSEARRLIEQGGVQINEEKKTNPEEMITITKEAVLKVGKRKFLRLLA